MDKADLFAIGRFARATRLSHKALRLYARLELLVPVYTDPASGYRYYAADQLATARLIRTMRQLEIPLATIREALAADPEEAEAIVAEYGRAFARRAAEIKSGIPHLIALMRNEETLAMAHSVEVKQTDAQQILSIVNRVTVKELVATNIASFQRLEAFAADQGGASAGPPFGLYHGPVNEEADGPVEVCLPVRREIAASGEITARELPAGPLASTTVTGADCQFPAILTAYDAVHDWITQNGYSIADSPREIWHAEDKLEIAWAFKETA